MIKNLENVVGFGGLVKKYRRQKGITQYELAEVIGISPSYVTLIETGRRKNLDFRYVMKLADYFKLKKNERREIYLNAGYSEEVLEVFEKIPADKIKKNHYLVEILTADPKKVNEENFVRGLYDALKLIVNQIPKTKKEKINYYKLLNIFEFFVMSHYDLNKKRHKVK